MSTAVQENVHCMRMLRGWHVLDSYAQAPDGRPFSIGEFTAVIEASCGHEVAREFTTYLASTQRADGPPLPGEQTWGRFYCERLAELKRKFHPPLMPNLAPVLP